MPSKLLKFVMFYLRNNKFDVFYSIKLEKLNFFSI